MKRPGLSIYQMLQTRSICIEATLVATHQLSSLPRLRVYWKIPEWFFFSMLLDYIGVKWDQGQEELSALKKDNVGKIPMAKLWVIDFSVCVCVFKVHLFYLESPSFRGRRRAERDLSSVGFLPIWLQRPELGSYKTGNQECLPGLPHGCRGLDREVEQLVHEAVLIWNVSISRWRTACLPPYQPQLLPSPILIDLSNNSLAGISICLRVHPFIPTHGI